MFDDTAPPKSVIVLYRIKRLLKNLADAQAALSKLDPVDRNLISRVRSQKITYHVF